MQTVLLRWWTAKENYKNYYDFLEKYEIEPYKEKKIKWSDVLQEDLGNNIEVLEIERPNKDFADYKAWKIMFEKYIPYFKDDIVFVWHSLWWTFILKYLEENPDFIEKFKKIILVAPGIDDSEEEVLWTFNVKDNLKNLEKNQNKFIVFASKDDFIVNYSEIETLQKYLPNLTYKVFENKGHFLDRKFPELVEEIKNLIIKK